jgi:Leucine-rich repeat (LRR) protein
MKTNHILLVLFILLSGFLFLSNRLDHQRNAKKIKRYKCKDMIFTPFLEGFDYSAHSSNPKKAYNRYSYSSLDLSLLNLNSLPENLFLNCSDCITRLDIQGNAFKEIPTTIGHLKSLKDLNLSSCGISTLKSQDGFALNIEELEILDLGNNNIEILSFLPISKPLNIVNFWKNNISTVDLPKDPSSYFVRNLNFFNNQFLEFPNELLRINGLEIINLSDNKIHFIQPLDPNKSDYSINNIVLKRNQITRFPSSFGRIKNLFTIELEENEIEGEVAFLDNHFGDLQELSILSQFIDSVIIAPTAIPNLTTLDFFDNNIVSFKAFKDNKQASLTSLILRENQLTEFPSDILHFQNLNNCDLSYNKIEGKVIIKDSNLRKLNLSNNKITAIHFTGENKIEELNLDYNQIKTFTFDEDALQNLEILHLIGNPNFSSSMSLDLLNKIKNLSTSQLQGVVIIEDESKTRLDFKNLDITSIYFSGINKVEELILEDNDIELIHIETGSLPNVVLFDLSNNSNLKRFPFDIFYEALNLKTIDIIGCENLPQEDIDRLKSIANARKINYLMDGEVQYYN